MKPSKIEPRRYYAPYGGLPAQTDLHTGRAVFTEAYAVIPKGVFSEHAHCREQQYPCRGLCVESIKVVRPYRTRAFDRRLILFPHLFWAPYWQQDVTRIPTRHMAPTG